MKHLFIINPAAGKKDRSTEISRIIEEIMKSNENRYEIYITQAPMDACRKIREDAQSGEEMRVYACGGDGTLNEVVNGAAGLKNVSVTHYPSGMGNDFIKCFGEDIDLFKDIEKLLSGEIVPFDLIKVGDRYGLNICSVGFDARVANNVHDYSKVPIISGTGAYILSLLGNFIKGVNQKLEVEIDGISFSGSFALICACNGRYYGGGFNPVPDAVLDDGLLEFLVVKKVSRLAFINLVGRYAKGKYRELSETITHISGRKMLLSSEKEIVVNIDGEIVWVKDTSFEVMPSSVNFILPRGIRFKPGK